MTSDELLRPVRDASPSSSAFNDAGISAKVCGTWESCLAETNCLRDSVATGRFRLVHWLAPSAAATAEYA